MIPLKVAVPVSCNVQVPNNSWAVVSIVSDAGKVIVGVLPIVDVVPNVTFVFTNNSLLIWQYRPVFVPLPTVRFVQDGVNVVQVPIAFSSAAVSTCPVVNVPSVAISTPVC